MSDRHAALMLIVERCKQVVEAHERRAGDHVGPTLSEKTAIASLRFTLGELEEFV